MYPLLSSGEWLYQLKRIMKHIRRIRRILSMIRPWKNPGDHRCRMEHRSILRLSARETYTAIVEPWANEFEITPAADCHIVALNAMTPPSLDVELYHGALIVTVLEKGSTYEFWRGTVRELWCPHPIPF
jgi:hypothetical protein